MAWRIYKEGQGKWLRGSLATVVALGGVFAVISLHGHLPPLPFRVPGIGWQLDGRHLIEAPILLLILGWGVWLYNRPKVVDFLIDTEHELKNRVTWPGKKEEVNASIVVVVTVVIMMVFIFSADSIFSFLQGLLYSDLWE